MTVECTQVNVTQRSVFQISEEIAENELEDADEIVEETEDTSVSALKDNEVESENDIEEQEFADAVDDDGLLKRFRKLSRNLTQPFFQTTTSKTMMTVKKTSWKRSQPPTPAFRC